MRMGPARVGIVCGAGAGYKRVGAGREQAKFLKLLQVWSGACLNFVDVGWERTKISSKRH